MRAQPDRRTDGRTGGLPDIQTDRQTDTHTHTDREVCILVGTRTHVLMPTYRHTATQVEQKDVDRHLWRVCAKVAAPAASAATADAGVED